MENYLTEESVELLLDEIIDAVESNSTREMQFEEIRNILVSQGIIVTDREKIQQDQKKGGKKIFVFFYYLEREKMDYLLGKFFEKNDGKKALQMPSKRGFIKTA